MMRVVTLLLMALLASARLAGAQPALAPGTYNNLAPGAYTLSPGGYNLTVVAPLYTLIVQTLGEGSATGAGSYPAGTPVAITATPAAGWSLQGYSSGCGPVTLMPASTLICTVTFSEDGAAPPATIPPATPWVLHARCGNGGTVGCSWYPSWSNLVYNATRRQLLFYPGAPGSVQAGNVVSFSLDPAVNPLKKWTVTHSPGIDDDRETCSMVVVEAQDVAYQDGCASGDPSPQQTQVLRINLATKQAVFQPGISWPGTGSLAILHDVGRNRLVAYGGWSQSQGFGLRTCETDATLPWSWVCVTALSDPPIWRSNDTQYARTSSQRSWREPNDVMGFVAADQNVWRYRGTPRAWTRQVTTGPTPPPSTLYAYHEPTKTVVGWTTCNPCTAPQGPGQTWLLREDASAWTLATPVGGNTPYPRTFNMPTLTYAEGCIWMLTGWSFQSDLYRYCPVVTP